MRGLFLFGVMLGLSLSLSVSAFGHGGDQPGPHGGAVQMPGGFHTEMVAGKDGSVKIYLLDINIKNPIVLNSSVEVEQRIGKMKPLKTTCKAQQDHFACAGLDLSAQGALIVRAKRAGQVGNEAEYPLPMKATK